MRCNCENLRCQECDGKGCKNEAGKRRAMYVGALCDGCASHTPERYLIDEVPSRTEKLTQLEFKDGDFKVAEQVAKRLGYTQTAYTSTSALWGLYCLPDRPTQRKGCVIKTYELGMLFVQDLEDLLMEDLRNG